jgi:hypothetical protein
MLIGLAVVIALLAFLYFAMNQGFNRPGPATSPNAPAQQQPAPAQQAPNINVNPPPAPNINVNPPQAPNINVNPPAAPAQPQGQPGSR